MAKWSESGILRKRVIKDKHEDLLVFGYACKLFRDDEKALYIDQGKHLIPWMGQDILKIDRYDCRGALSELDPYEATREDYDARRWLGLNESERRIEMLCDAERYYALKHNEEDLQMYKEEELKRLHQKGSEVQYNYDVPTDPENSQEVPDMVEQEDEAFIPPSELNVPSDIEVPKTMKENARIEKTALFISKQGPQMEILIKTKQADNPQFSFMNKDDPLYQYYKHILGAIKSGQYTVKSESTNTDEKADDPSSGQQDSQEEYYLHPSLFATSVQRQTPAPTPLPTVIYKPSVDCAYSQLVNRIQGVTQSSDSPPPPLPPPTAAAATPSSSDAQTAQMTYEQQYQYHQYYYATQYYEYYKQMAAQQGTTNTSDFVLDPSTATTTAYTQYMQSNPYAQIVSNLSQSKDYNQLEPPTTTTIITTTTSSSSSNEITKAPVLYNHNEPQHSKAASAATATTVVLPPAPITQPSITATLPPPPPPVSAPIEPIIKKPLLAIADYGSDSEEEEEEDEETKPDETIKVPPNETQQIIDKMASYVAKNGKDFESIVKSKKDTRFEFLNDHHEYNAYYKSKIKQYTDGTAENGEKQNDETIASQQNGIAAAGNKPKEKKIITPVSFSIKKPRDDAPKEIKSALLMEESDDDQEEIVEASVEATAPNAVVVMVQETSLTSSLNEPIVPTPTTTITSSETKREPGGTTEKVETVKSKNPDELIMDMIDLTGDAEEKRESKRAEDRKKDKITAAVREKLALQLERKKKAAAFLKMKSVPTTSKTRTKTTKLENNDEKEESHAKKQETVKVEDSEPEAGEIRKHKKSSKKKKSHKRKRSKSRHRSESRHKNKEHKKSKKKRKRSKSASSRSSLSS